jgi:hypothetical protein
MALLNAAALPASVQCAVLGAGGLLLVGMLTGVWKYASLMRSPARRAHRYVDIAHRASLMYSFAALVLAALAALSVWPEAINCAAVVANLVFFAAAIGTYVVHGWLRDTDNQLRPPYRLGQWPLAGVLVHGFMLALVAGEIGGVVVLLAGVVRAL